MEHKKMIEAALFISTSPLTLDQLARVTGIHSLGHVKEIVESLKKDYENSGLEIFNSSDGYSMQVRPHLLPRVAHLTPYSDLREGPKRTLALVTLKEPVKQSEIIRIQGNKAYSYIKELKKRGLIVTENIGHTKILKLTQEFERYFGEEKEKIKEQLEKHLQTSGDGGESVYEEPEPTENKPSEPPHEFLDKQKTKKEKAKASVIRKDAAKELSKETPQETNLKASHSHAFEEIE